MAPATGATRAPRDRAAPRRAASAGPTDRGRGGARDFALWGMGGFGTLAGMRHACRALVCSVGPPPPACRAPLDNPPGYFFRPSVTHSVRATCLVTILRETSATVCSHLNPRAHGGDGVAVGRAVGEGAPPPIRIDVCRITTHQRNPCSRARSAPAGVGHF
jgi:hypothetical protein